uniref:J domain-containing protein n=1 Tax=Alexandrium monilatum TaxID=311494 RepID=A0A7S4RAK6_9DINO
MACTSAPPQRLPAAALRTPVAGPSAAPVSIFSTPDSAGVGGGPLPPWSSQVGGRSPAAVARVAGVRAAAAAVAAVAAEWSADLDVGPVHAAPPERVSITTRPRPLPASRITSGAPTPQAGAPGPAQAATPPRAAPLAATSAAATGPAASLERVLPPPDPGEPPSPTPRSPLHGSRRVRHSRGSASAGLGLAELQALQRHQHAASVGTHAVASPHADPPVDRGGSSCSAQGSARGPPAHSSSTSTLPPAGFGLDLGSGRFRFTETAAAALGGEHLASSPAAAVATTTAAAAASAFPAGGSVFGRAAPDRPFGGGGSVRSYAAGVVPAPVPGGDPSSWCTRQTVLLGPVLEMQGVTVIDRSVASSVTSAVERLNRGSLPCPEGYCVVYSASSGGYYLLFRNDKRSEALTCLSQRHRDSQAPPPLPRSTSFAQDASASRAPTAQSSSVQPPLRDLADQFTSPLAAHAAESPGPRVQLRRLASFQQDTSPQAAHGGDAQPLLPRVLSVGQDISPVAVLTARGSGPHALLQRCPDSALRDPSPAVRQAPPSPAPQSRWRWTSSMAREDTPDVPPLAHSPSIQPVWPSGSVRQDTSTSATPVDQSPATQSVFPWTSCVEQDQTPPTPPAARPVSQRASAAQQDHTPLAPRTAQTAPPWVSMVQDPEVAPAAPGVQSSPAPPAFRQVPSTAAWDGRGRHAEGSLPRTASARRSREDSLPPTAHHADANPVQPGPSLAQEADGEATGEQPGPKVIGRFVTYCCPRCAALVSSAKEAIAHCSSEDETASTKSSEGGGGGGGAEPASRGNQAPAGESDAAPGLGAGASTTVAATATPRAEQASTVQPAATPATQLGSVRLGPTGPATAGGQSTAPAAQAAGVAAEAAQSEEPPAPAPAPPAAPVLPRGEPVAYDERGAPVIVRQVESGRVRHIVLNEDGSIKAFGHSTVASLASSSEDDAQRWVDNLTDRELRALVHDVGQRLLSNSQLYQCRQAELERVADAMDCAYFGVTAGAPDKELDNAYRKMAKRMHPDKNGGTEDAKRRFQMMKERYEGLKARRNKGQDKGDQQEGSDDKQATDEKGDEGDDGAGEKAPGRKEAYDEDDPLPESKQEEDDKTIAYDPNDRNSLHKTVWKMLGQFKTMQQGLQEIERQLRRASGQVG